MEAVIISNYALIREGLNSILSKYINMKIKLSAETLKEAVTSIKENEIDIILIEMHEDNPGELNLIKEMKEKGIKSKFIILDFDDNKSIFIKAIKCGVEGYITGKSNDVEILHIVDQIYRGKKYYDACFIDSMVNESPLKTEAISQLTTREKEILCEIGKGINNHKISEKLYISEHTVKKHINHIFDKLNIKDRTQAALYANKCGIINKSAC